MALGLGPPLEFVNCGVIDGNGKKKGKMPSACATNHLNKAINRTPTLSYRWESI